MALSRLTHHSIGGAITVNGFSLRVNGTAALQTNPVTLNGGTIKLRTNTAATLNTGAFTLGGNATMHFANNGSGSSLDVTFGSPINVSGNGMLTVTSGDGFKGEI